MCKLRHFYCEETEISAVLNISQLLQLLLQILVIFLLFFFMHMSPHTHIIHHTVKQTRTSIAVCTPADPFLLITITLLLLRRQQQQ